MREISMDEADLVSGGDPNDVLMAIGGLAIGAARARVAAPVVTAGAIYGAVSLAYWGGVAFGTGAYNGWWC